MLLSMIIREHSDDFELFAKAAGKVSFTSMLNDFISEFKQQDCSLDEIDEMLGESGDEPVLGAKLRELKGVIEAYEEAIKNRFTDSEDYIAMYVDAIKDSKLVRGKSIWIYGYDNITPKFADAVMELAGVAESVNFIINRSDFGLDDYARCFTGRCSREHQHGGCGAFDDAAGHRGTKGGGHRGVPRGARVVPLYGRHHEGAGD
jgi:ATP-dependent helicase/nuclease subunit B